MNPFKLALLHLLRHPGNTLIGLVAISLAVGLSGMLLRLHLVSSERFGNMVRSGDAIIGAKAGSLEILLGAMNLEGDYPSFFTHRLFWSLQNRHRLQFFENPQDVVGLVPILYCAKYKAARVIGTTDDFLTQPGLKVEFAQGSWMGSGREVVVGSAIASRENLRLGDTLSVRPWTSSNPAADGSVFPHAFEVKGIMKPLGNRWDGALFIGMAQARGILEKSSAAESGPWGSEVVHYIIVHLNPGGFRGLQNLVNNMTVAQAVSVPAAVAELERITGSSRALAMAAIVMALLLGGLCVAGLFGGRFEVLSRELAVLRALGYSRSETSARLLWEAVLLGGAACILGAGLDISLFPILRERLSDSFPSLESVVIPVWRSYPVWAGALGATLMAAWLPLVRLYGLDAHRALRKAT